MDKKCSTCKYRSNRTSLNYCDYIGHTGHSRGCAADENCDKYEPRKRKRKVKGGAVEILNEQRLKEKRSTYLTRVSRER